MMISFLKKKIKYSELEAWINSEEEKINDKLGGMKHKLREKILVIIKNAYKNVDTLEKAKLHNPDINQRTIQIMQGNRDSYVQKTRDYLSKIEVSFDTYDEELKSYSQSTARAFYVLKEFFANEVSKVADNVRTIDELHKRIMVGSPEKERLMRLKNLVLEFENAKSQKKKSAQVFTAIKDENEKLNKQLKKIESKLKSHKNSSVYKEYLSKLEEKNSMEEKLKNIKNQVVSDFSVLQRPLKKYSKMSLDHALIELYLQGPFETLLKDKQLEIFDVLQNLKEQIVDKKVEVKESIAQKSIQIIDKFSIGYLSDLSRDFKVKNEEYEGLNRSIKSDGANLSLKELEYRLEHIKEKIDSLQSKKQVKVPNIDKIKNNIEQECIKRNIILF